MKRTTSISQIISFAQYTIMLFTIKFKLLKIKNNLVYN